MNNKDTIRQIADKFFPYAQEKMGFDKPANIEYIDDIENAADPFGKTAHYNPETMTVSLYITDRHPKDVLRSLSHELQHHTQNCRGDFKGTQVLDDSYAQTNEHMREMEKEAYEIGNIVFRDFEDSIKNQKLDKSTCKKIVINIKRA